MLGSVFVARQPKNWPLLECRPFSRQLVRGAGEGRKTFSLHDLGRNRRDYWFSQAGFVHRCEGANSVCNIGQPESYCYLLIGKGGLGLVTFVRPVLHSGRSKKLKIAQEPEPRGVESRTGLRDVGYQSLSRLLVQAIGTDTALPRVGRCAPSL